MGLPPQLKLLAVFSHKLGHDSRSEQCNNICPYRKYEHTVHSGMDTQIHTDCAHVFLSLNPSLVRVLPNNLASYARVILPSHIDCISVFEDISTIKNAVTCTHTGRRTQ